MKEETGSKDFAKQASKFLEQNGCDTYQFKSGGWLVSMSLTDDDLIAFAKYRGMVTND